MWIYCILIGLFQLIILLMLSGILFSIAAISRLMEITIIVIYPTTVFFLRQSANFIIKPIEDEMNLDAVLFNLSDKIPSLRNIFRPEYVPYLTTAATVLIGWLLVSWIFQLIWMLRTPITISAVIIALICPATSKWYFQQLGTNLEEIVYNVTHKFQAFR